MPAIDAWRKIAAASWSAPRDPQIYGDLEVDAGRVLELVEDERARTGVHVTVTHVVGWALARALAENPDVNVRLTRGRFVRRETVDIFFVVAVDHGRQLSGTKIVGADRKSPAEIAEELERRARRLRAGDEAHLGRSKQLLGRAPAWALRLGLRLATWLVADRGVSLERIGLPSDAFGSAIVSSVSAFGAEHAYGPLSPWYRMPVLVLVSEIREKPSVVDGAVAPRPILQITATLDHRYVDGAHAGHLVRSFKACLASPSPHGSESAPRQLVDTGA